MTTATWSSVFSNANTAGFEAWGSELSGKFATVGLVQTTDTGQINWSTVTLPGTSNTSAGYEIWKLSDSSLYFKIEYGTGNTTGVPAMWLTVGTGSNGSGTLTGQASTREQLNISNSVPSTVTAYPTYLCATANFFGLALKVGAAAAGAAWSLWCVGKSVDSTGSPTTTGYYVLSNNANTAGAMNLQTVRTASTAQTLNRTTSFCIFPGKPSTSSDGTNNQLYLHFMNIPGVLPCLYSASHIGAELSPGTSLTATLFGSTSHTYLCVNNASITFDAAASLTGLVMLWE